MGSIKKELVGVKDINGYWSNILCISCSEGHDITDFDTMIKLIKECQEPLAECEFILEGEEIYVLVDELTQVNPGEFCK